MNTHHTPRLQRSILFACLTLASGVAFGGDEVEGFLEPYRTVNVSFAEMGVLKAISVTEGMRVDEGQVLAELAHDVQLATLEIARRSATATGKLKSAQAELKFRRDLHSKYAGLHLRNHATQDEVDRAALDVALSEAALITVQEDLEVRNLECRRIESQIEECRLRSPIRGSVVRVFKEAGEFVAANDPAVMSIVQLDPLKVEFAVAPTSAEQIHVGSDLEVHIGEELRPLKGHVDFVSPVISAESGTVRVSISVSNSDGALKGGERCRLTVAPSTSSRPVRMTERTGNR